MGDVMEWLDSMRVRRAADVKSLLASKLGCVLSIDCLNRSKEGRGLSKEGRGGCSRETRWPV